MPLVIVPPNSFVVVLLSVYVINSVPINTVPDVGNSFESFNDITEPVGEVEASAADNAVVLVVCE